MYAYFIAGVSILATIIVAIFLVRVEPFPGHLPLAGPCVSASFKAPNLLNSFMDVGTYDITIYIQVFHRENLLCNRDEADMFTEAC